jgi:hypothetical protein
MTRFVIWAAPLLIVAAPAFAQQQAGMDAGAAAPAVAPAKPKKVCRTNQVTGRRIAQTQCYTAAEWADYDRMQREAATKLVNDVRGFAGRGDLSSSRDGSLSTSTMFGLGSPQ